MFFKLSSLIEICMARGNTMRVTNWQNSIVQLHFEFKVNDEVLSIAVRLRMLWTSRKDILPHWITEVTDLRICGPIASSGGFYWYTKDTDTHWYVTYWYARIHTESLHPPHFLALLIEWCYLDLLRTSANSGAFKLVLRDCCVRSTGNLTFRKLVQSNRSTCDTHGSNLSSSQT